MKLKHMKKNYHLILNSTELENLSEFMLHGGIGYGVGREVVVAFREAREAMLREESEKKKNEDIS
jgi:hypothetical protein